MNDPEIPTYDPAKDGPWACSEMECSRCGKEWVAVHPLYERVECPVCKYLEQVPPWDGKPFAKGIEP